MRAAQASEQLQGPRGSMLVSQENGVTQSVYAPGYLHVTTGNASEIPGFYPLCLLGAEAGLLFN